MGCPQRSTERCNVLSEAFVKSALHLFCVSVGIVRTTRSPSHLLAMLIEHKSAVASFPVERMHAIAAASAATCVALNVAVHLCTPFLWPGYRGASYKTKLAWCNRIVSAVHVSPDTPNADAGEGRMLCSEVNALDLSRAWCVLQNLCVSGA